MSVVELKELLEHLATLGAVQAEVVSGDTRVVVCFGLDLASGGEDFKVPATDTDWS